MKGKTLIAVLVAAAATGAGAFFRPLDDFINPVGRPSTCTLVLTWDSADPESVASADENQVGTLRACRHGRGLALATELQRSLRPEAVN